eukprot:m.109171 g.109171  ORF g.109171 m.109171 type:complete len:1498 (-) comp13995_c0_seq2:2112-6605(-)
MEASKGQNWEQLTRLETKKIAENMSQSVKKWVDVVSNLITGPEEIPVRENPTRNQIIAQDVGTAMKDVYAEDSENEMQFNGPDMADLTLPKVASMAKPTSTSIKFLINTIVSDTNDKNRIIAVQLLRKIARNPSWSKLIVKTGAMSRIVSVLIDPDLILPATLLILNLAHGDDQVNEQREILVEAGVVQKLSWGLDFSKKVSVRHAILNALRNIVVGGPSFKDRAALDDAFVPAIIRCLETPHPRVQAAAATLMMILCSSDENPSPKEDYLDEFRREHIMLCNVHKSLITLLQSKEDETLQSSLSALLFLGATSLKRLRELLLCGLQFRVSALIARGDKQHKALLQHMTCLIRAGIRNNKGNAYSGITRMYPSSVNLFASPLEQNESRAPHNPAMNDSSMEADSEYSSQQYLGRYEISSSRVDFEAMREVDTPDPDFSSEVYSDEEHVPQTQESIMEMEAKAASWKDQSETATRLREASKRLLHMQTSNQELMEALTATNSSLRLSELAKRSMFAQVDNLTDKNNLLKEELLCATEKIKLLEQRNALKCSDIAHEHGACIACERDATNFFELKDELEAVQKELQASKEKAVNIDYAEAAYDEGSAGFFALKSQLKDVMEELEGTKQALEKAREDAKNDPFIRALKEKEEQALKEREEEPTELKTSSAAMEAQSAKIFSLKSELKEVSSELDKLKRTHDNFRKKNSEMKQTLKETKKERNSLNQSLKRVQGVNESLRTSQKEMEIILETAKQDCVLQQEFIESMGLISDFKRFGSGESASKATKADGGEEASKDDLSQDTGYHSDPLLDTSERSQQWRAEQSEMIGQMNDLRNEYAALHAENETLRSQLENLAGELEQAKFLESTLREELEEVSRQAASTQTIAEMQQAAEKTKLEYIDELSKASKERDDALQLTRDAEGVLSELSRELVSLATNKASPEDLEDKDFDEMLHKYETMAMPLVGDSFDVARLKQYIRLIFRELQTCKQKLRVNTAMEQELLSCMDTMVDDMTKSRVAPLQPGAGLTDFMSAAALKAKECASLKCILSNKANKNVISTAEGEFVEFLALVMDLLEERMNTAKMLRREKTSGKEKKRFDVASEDPNDYETGDNSEDEEEENLEDDKLLKYLTGVRADLMSSNGEITYEKFIPEQKLAMFNQKLNESMEAYASNSDSEGTMEGNNEEDNQTASLNLFLGLEEDDDDPIRRLTQSQTPKKLDKSVVHSTPKFDNTDRQRKRSNDIVFPPPSDLFNDVDPGSPTKDQYDSWYADIIAEGRTHRQSLGDIDDSIPRSPVTPSNNFDSLDEAVTDYDTERTTSPYRRPYIPQSPRSMKNRLQRGRQFVERLMNSVPMSGEESCYEELAYPPTEDENFDPFHNKLNTDLSMDSGIHFNGLTDFEDSRLFKPEHSRMFTQNQEVDTDLWHTMGFNDEDQIGYRQPIHHGNRSHNNAYLNTATDFSATAPLPSSSGRRKPPASRRRPRMHASMRAMRKQATTSGDDDIY